MILHAKRNMLSPIPIQSTGSQLAVQKLALHVTHDAAARQHDLRRQQVDLGNTTSHAQHSLELGRQLNASAK